MTNLIIIAAGVEAILILAAVTVITHRTGAL